MVARSALRALTQQGLRKAFNAWQETASAQKATVAAARKLLVSLRSPKLRSGFNAWVEHCSEGQAQQQTMQHMEARWRLRGASNAIGAWRELVEARRAMRRAAYTLKNLGTRRALNAWKETFVAILQARLQVALALDAHPLHHRARRAAAHREQDLQAVLRVLRL